ncbi:MAG: hypothetical protein H0W72_12140, partial [Planctomycetes bacterium]|nr:hypothetical protein [Planctomycetota bacterium]
MPRLPINLPQFGESAAEATVVTWLVAAGARVAADQELVEVQTEKSVMTVASPAAGTLAEQCVKPNQRLAVGDTLCWLEVDEGVVVPKANDRSAAAATMAAAVGQVPAHSRHAFAAELPLPTTPGPEFISPRLRARMA